MTDEITKTEETQVTEESMADFEEYWAVPTTVTVGKIYTGKIVRIDTKDVYLDIQAKKRRNRTFKRICTRSPTTFIGAGS